MEVTAYITTLKERCRMCYTCVRECPAKAIRISTGQAEIIAERCIACGNCVRVCSQGAKQPVTSIDKVDALLASGRQVAACVAPSFPAEFGEIDYHQLVGMIRRLGFRRVLEVSFGADLVAREYRELLTRPDEHRYIATSCPAIIGYVQRYYPELIDCLAPIVSPMIATARAARQVYGSSAAVVFIGPCIAKKAEADSPSLAGDVDAVLTFAELREMFGRAGYTADTVEPSEFDPPHGGIGGIFPVGRGMLQAASIQEDLMTGEVVATQGRTHVVEAIKEFASGQLGAKLLEALCCEGCIMGAGITSELPLFGRRRQVRQYVCKRAETLDQARWLEEMQRAAILDLTRTFQANDQRIPAPQDVQFYEVMARMGKFTPQDELNCGACGYDTCRDHAIAICKGLAESEMCLPHTIEQLRQAVKEVEASNRQLAEAQEALMQSEKLASMGQLAAGIAHEVNNPLGVVLMYAHLLLDSCEKGSPMRDDLVMIAEQADRCKKIVAGLLHFARQNKLARYPADVRELADRALKAVKVPDRITLKVEHHREDCVAEIDRDQIVQVLTNLINNAIDAMESGGTLTIETGGDEYRVWLSVGDTGTGISEENLKKVFDPFFTTKPLGKGTGLGLAVTYGIIKMHCGDIQIQSNTQPSNGPTGTTFTVTLPRLEG